MANTYYVYSLKDPREKPAKIFYVGKGTGSRATEHILQRDNTRKGKFIQDLHQLDITPIVSKIATNLTEEQALQIELALIGTFGTLITWAYNQIMTATSKTISPIVFWEYSSKKGYLRA